MMSAVAKNQPRGHTHGSDYCDADSHPHDRVTSRPCHYMAPCDASGLPVRGELFLALRPDDSDAVRVAAVPDTLPGRQCPGAESDDQDRDRSLGVPCTVGDYER